MQLSMQMASIRRTGSYPWDLLSDRGSPGMIDPLSGFGGGTARAAGFPGDPGDEPLRLGGFAVAATPARGATKRQGARHVR